MIKLVLIYLLSFFLIIFFLYLAIRRKGLYDKIVFSFSFIVALLFFFLLIFITPNIKELNYHDNLFNNITSTTIDSIVLSVNYVDTMEGVFGRQNVVIYETYDIVHVLTKESSRTLQTIKYKIWSINAVLYTQRKKSEMKIMRSEDGITKLRIMLNGWSVADYENKELGNHLEKIMLFTPKAGAPR